MAACHSMEIRSFPSENVRNKIKRREETNIVVVGGGLSSAQIVDMAIRKGVRRVLFLLRSELKGGYLFYMSGGSICSRLTDDI